jgi:poly-gamma-glutamate capsule biosynthesis protein CapA/YwtB (metallophosphatase superfamily)
MKRLLSLPCLSLFFVAAAQKPKDTITIIGVGDVMLGTSYPTGYLPPDDGRSLLSPVAPYLKSADVTFGNHEGSLFDGKGIPKKCADSTNCFAFKSPERYAVHLKNAGFTVMSVANNHSGDFGTDGRERTIEVLRKAGIVACGTEKKPIVIFNKDGVRYGLAAFAPNPGTQDINDIKTAAKIVAYLDSLCDIVIVSFHGGGEGLRRQHVPRQKEIFLGENRGNVYKFARAVIDAGADVVFGHGPHVPRAVDLYKGKFIVYSLGNFATYGRFNLKREAGIAPIMKICVNRQGQFLKGEIIPVKQTGEGGPQLDKTSAVIRKIKTLTAQDFPESALVIDGKGSITRKAKKKGKQTRLLS